MTNYDELLARLDEVTEKGRWSSLIILRTESGETNIFSDAAAAIRELTENNTHYLAAKRTAEENELKCAQELDEVRAQLSFAQTALAAEKHAREEEKRIAGETIRGWMLSAAAAESRLAAVFEETRERAAKVCDGAERNYIAAAKEALDNGKVLMGHRQLVAAYLAAAIRALESAAPQEAKRQSLGEQDSRSEQLAAAAVTVQDEAKK